jgi:DHA2 family methylenomycin A resistance protein-like MFS transporter
MNHGPGRSTGGEGLPHPVPAGIGEVDDARRDAVPQPAEVEEPGGQHGPQRSGAGFASTAAVGVLLNLGYYGMLYLSTLYLQNERGYDALGAGLALLPTVCMAVVAAPLSGRLTARYGPYVPMTGALLLGAAGFVGWLLAGPDTPYWMLLPALIATGLATPSTVPAATAAIVHAAPAKNAGVASAVFNVARQLGNALGVALFASLIAGRDLVSGLHISALIASAAFFVAALLALSSWRNAKARAAA